MYMYACIYYCELCIYVTMYEFVILLINILDMVNKQSRYNTKISTKIIFYIRSITILFKYVHILVHVQTTTQHS